MTAKRYPQTDLTVLQVRVYDSLVLHWREFGRAPRQRDLGRELHCSVQAIIRAYHVLEKLGHITVAKGETRGAKPVDLDRVVEQGQAAPWQFI